MRRSALLAAGPFAFLALALCVSACGSGSSRSASPTAVSSGTLIAQPTSAAASLTPGVQAAQPTATLVFYVGSLTDIDFADLRTGWASGANGIIATKDGGHTWQSQHVPSDQYLSLDFVSPQVGWAAGVHTLIKTSDGGTTWATVSAETEPFFDVDFVDPNIGWAVAIRNPYQPSADGRLLKTADGGRTWLDESAPASVRSVCAINAHSVWVVGAKEVVHTTDGGATWATSFTLPSTGNLWSGQLRCTPPNVAWVQFADGVATGNLGQAVYRTLDGGDHWQVMMAHEFNDTVKAPDTPGPYPGPFSVVDASTVFVMGYCPMCGAGTSNIRSTHDGGATWRPDMAVAAPASYAPPVGLHFVDSTHGWAALSSNPMGEILATVDGGRTWVKQYPSSP